MLLENLDALMKARGMTKRSLAIESGVPASTIYSLYKKGWENVELGTLVKIARCFGVTLDYLVTGETTLKPHELAILDAYRRHPELRPAVDKLLDVQEDAEKKTARPEDPESTVRRIRAAFGVNADG